MKKEMNNLENRRDFLRRSAAAVSGLAFLMVAGKTASAAMINTTPSGCNYCALDCTGGCGNDCTNTCAGTCHGQGQSGWK